MEENKDLLISIINSIVSSEDQIKEVILLNPYNPKNFLKDKTIEQIVEFTGLSKKEIEKSKLE